jgi:outer membrane protein assembly factor BamB
VIVGGAIALAAATTLITLALQPGKWRKPRPPARTRRELPTSPAAQEAVMNPIRATPRRQHYPNLSRWFTHPGRRTMTARQLRPDMRPGMRRQGIGAVLVSVMACSGLVAAGVTPALAAAPVMGQQGHAPGTATLTVNPTVTLSPATGPPTGTVTVAGVGFAAFEAVDIYFDTTDEALASTGATGNFSGITISVPASAIPGTHYITAVGRHSGHSAQATFTVNTNWSQFRYSVKHKGSNPYENVLNPGNVAGIDQDWGYTTGNSVYSSPAVVNGVVYIGSGDGNVYALNAATGAKLWNYTTGNQVSSSPAVVNGVVYVGSYDGNVYALNAATGAKLWNYPTGNSVVSSPAVVNGVVYVGSYDGNVYALNAATGAKLWNYPTGLGVYSSPAVAGGVVYIGSLDGNVYALNAATGAKLWNYTNGGGTSSPAVANGVVYVSSGAGTVYALKAASGANLWSYTTGNFVYSSPAVANGVVYVGSFDGNVYAFDPTGGTAAIQRPATRQLHPDYTLRPTQQSRP